MGIFLHHDTWVLELDEEGQEGERRVLLGSGRKVRNQEVEQVKWEDAGEDQAVFVCHYQRLIGCV